MQDRHPAGTSSGRAIGPAGGRCRAGAAGPGHRARPGPGNRPPSTSSPTRRPSPGCAHARLLACTPASDGMPRSMSTRRGLSRSARRTASGGPLDASPTSSASGSVASSARRPLRNSGGRRRPGGVSLERGRRPVPPRPASPKPRHGHGSPRDRRPHRTQHPPIATTKPAGSPSSASSAASCSTPTTPTPSTYPPRRPNSTASTKPPRRPRPARPGHRAPQRVARHPQHPPKFAGNRADAYRTAPEPVRKLYNNACSPPSPSATAGSTAGTTSSRSIAC